MTAECCVKTLKRLFKRLACRFTSLLSRGGAVAVLAVLLMTGRGECAMAKMFSLERPRLGALFEYRFREIKQVSPVRRSLQTSHQFSEGLTITTRGYLYHQNLLIFDLSLEPTWYQQQQVVEPGSDSSGRSFFLDYGLNATLLPDRPLSLQFVARHNTSSSTSTLAPITTSENTLHGATLIYRSRKLPTRLGFTMSEAIQEGFYPSTITADNLRLISRHRAERSETYLNADYDQRLREAPGLSQATDIASLRLRNNLQLTEDRRVRLASGLSSRYTEAGQGETTELNLNEMLDWLHTDPRRRLQVNSNYAASYNASKRDGILSETIPLTAGLFLSHRLYENLLSSLSGTGGYTKFDGGNEKNYGAMNNFDYTRRIPKGQINFNMGHGYLVTDRTVTTDFIEVVGERFTFNDLTITLLASRHIDMESIQVFTGDGSVEYVRDFDYTMTTVGAFVRIDRLPLGGMIDDGDTVLVSYRYRSDPTAKLGTLSRTYGAGTTLWSVLNLRYQLSLTAEDFLGGIPPEFLADDTMHTVSARLDYGWSDTTLTAEDEERAAGNSRRGWTIKQNFRWRLSPALSLGAGGGYGESELVDSGSSGQAYNLRLDGQWRPRANQQWRLEAFQNINTTDLPTRDESQGLGLFYIWRYGLWSLQVDYRHLIDKQPLVGQERTMDTVNVKLRRFLF